MTIRGIINVPAKREHLAFVTPEKVCPFMVANLPWSDSTGSGREADRCRDWPQQLAVTLNPLHICTHTFTLPHFLSIVLHMLHPSVEGWRAKIAEDWMNKIPWNELAPPANCPVQSFLSVVEFPCFPCVCRFIAVIPSRILQIGDSVMALVLLQCCCATESIFLCSLYFHFHLSMALNFFGTLLFCVKFLFCKFCSLTLFLCFSFHLCILWSHTSSVRYLPFQTILFFLA